MSDLDEAIAMLERAVARLEAAPPMRPPEPLDSNVAEIANVLAARVDAALARIDQMLEDNG